MGTQLPSPQNEQSPNFRPMSIVPKRSPISATAEHLLKLASTSNFSSSSYTWAVSNLWRNREMTGGCGLIADTYVAFPTIRSPYRGRRWPSSLTIWLINFTTVLYDVKWCSPNVRCVLRMMATDCSECICPLYNIMFFFSNLFSHLSHCFPRWLIDHLCFRCHMLFTYFSVQWSMV